MIRSRPILTLVATAAVSCTKAPASHPDVRDDALRRAQVWMEPATRIEDARLDENPPAPDGFAADAVVDCRFKPGGASGNSPKFDCLLADGRVIKVKYGKGNPEVFAEVAATRLLAALGFPADRMYVVKGVRCFGCPADPFKNLQCMNQEGATLADCFPRLDYARAESFDPAVIERPMKGRHIDSKAPSGWTWEELARIDPAAGGASRAQVDALRLMAVFLGHWDNKSKNQRLVCLSHGESGQDGVCERPIAMVQDLGATFGPAKLDLAHWAATPIWTDVEACGVSMKALPYGGSTFPDARISEEGREFLASRLRRLSTAQIRALFDGARITQYSTRSGGGDLEQWVQTFEDKVAAIVDRAPCPPAL